MSPFDDSGQWIADEALARGEVAPTVITADTNTPGFDTARFDEIEATLGMHAYFQTTMAGTNDDLDFIARRPGAQANASATTAMTGANNDITFTAAGQSVGSRGNGIRVRIQDPGPNNAAIAISVSGREILIRPVTSAAGAITSTGGQVVSAVNGNAGASALVSAANAGGNDGTGVVTAMDAAVLSGGISSTGITVTLVVAGNSTALSVAVSGDAITINSATTSGGAASSTANQVRAAVNGDAAASQLVAVNLKSGNDGTGVVSAFGSSPLVAIGGTGTLDVALQDSDDNGVTWASRGSFAQRTTLGSERQTFGPLGDDSRWNFDIGGSVTACAVSITSAEASD